MDRRAQLVQGLREVEKLIAEDEVNLSRQRRLIALLTKGGRDVTDAKKLLGEFETIRQQHVILQTRILAELGD
jgi:hypothetical protein